MIPNNNLSILPWYTSIEQQNARKWWAYNRVYPLFMPAYSLLPFQVIRDAMRQALQNDDIFNGYIRSDGTRFDGGNGIVAAYLAENIPMNTVYLVNVPLPVSVSGVSTVSAVALDADGNLLDTYISTGTPGTVKWVFPAGTETIYVQVKNPDFPPYGYVFTDDSEPVQIYDFKIYDFATGLEVVDNVRRDAILGAISIKPAGEKDIIIFPGTVFSALLDGRYYAVMSDRRNTWYSEVFTVVNDISPYLKIEWWDNEDFIMDAGTIVYKYAGGTQFRNVLYLCADIGKPEYIFEEEGESRDGYFFPTKQISEKKYRFSFLASEYLLDVMRFIRMADYAYIEKNGQRYSLDTFLITPEWEDNGDVASVTAEFETATVAKKIGQGYLKAQRGDFNDDFNNDYNNQQ